MRVAVVGLGRMGAPIAERLAAAGHAVAGWDASEAARQRVAGARGALTEALAGADIVLLCLPDAAAVRTVAGALGGAPLVVDLSSSLPALTRSLGLRMIDAPMSGGVAGARAGTLTIMAGGDEALLAEARPALEAFSNRIFHAGPLGAGHAVKALNNALSAVALVATSEAVAAARVAAHSPEGTVRRLNAGLGRTQNSEVKFPRDILPGRYASGFSAGLMTKDVSTALAIARARGVAAPLVAVVRETWLRMDGAADFTRIFETVAAPPPIPAARLDLDHFDRAVAAACMIAAVEMVAVAEAEGLERGRFLEIVAEGSGRSEAVIHFEDGLGVSRERALRSLDAVREVAAATQPVPALALTAELLRSGSPWR